MANTIPPCEKLILDFTENYMEKIFYFCVKKTANRFEAEDLTQDISLNIISSLNRGMIPMSFSAWVWKIAHNRYRAWADKRRKQNESINNSDIYNYEIVDENKDILDEMVHREELSLLRRELAFIQSDYRHIIVSYYIDNKCVRDIATSLSLTEDTVKQRLSRARKKMKEGMNMAREFGKLSYNPENISFIINGLFGSNGEPWNYISRSLCKNIMLAAFRNPATVDELAIEVGVALPYMEEELTSLVEATLIKKNGNKYETNFFIVSAIAQEIIFKHIREIAPELTKAIIDIIEFEVSWKNENCPEWHEGYQTYEDMKWALLMCETDTVKFGTLNQFNKYEKDVHNIGPWGHTLRPNQGEWDILGMETYRGDAPALVGLSGCVSSPEEKDLPEIMFRQFKFQYHNIEKVTPNILTYSDGQALVSVAKGESNKVNEIILNRLIEYGYIQKTDNGYKPTFLVMFQNQNKQMTAEAQKKHEALRQKAIDIATSHYLFCKKQIYKEIPEFLKKDEFQINHACANIFDFRGAILEEAIHQGYISYDEHDDSKMLGALLTI